MITVCGYGSCLISLFPPPPPSLSPDFCIQTPRFPIFLAMQQQRPCEPTVPPLFFPVEVSKGDHLSGNLLCAPEGSEVVATSVQ